MRVEAGSVERISEIDVEHEQVQIEGRVRGRKPITCPVTEQPVIGYRIRIEVADGKGGWRIVVELTRYHEFEVCDERGAALIHWLDPLILARRRPSEELEAAVARPQFYQLLGLDEEDFASSLGSAVFGRVDLVDVRYWATFIERGSEVFVCGRPVLRVDPRGVSDGYRGAPTHLTLRSTGGRPLLIADGNRESLLATLDDRLVD